MRKTTLRLWVLLLSKSSSRSVVSFRLNFSCIKLKLFQSSVEDVNPLNAELNPICHLLILLGDLTFMGKCIVSISNKMQLQTVYLNLETVLHISGGTSTHNQERIQLYLKHLVFVTPLLLSAALSAHSNRFQLFHESGR
jgi:hypothetical protein